jgi:tetratricopeptide (TPR) repeat protein
MKKILFTSLLTALMLITYGQESTIREEFISFPTYNFSDPDPVARPGKFYPYFKFDGYSATSVIQKHKMIVMENNWIKVWIAPDIGGKVWGAQDKKTGKFFIYFNNVVKFRDIAMRGPWTSGGIEFNFGSIGHAPTTATPVDYRYQKNSDGSVSCFVGTQDLTSRTEWRVEVRLPEDKAWFETITYWDNPTTMKTSLYHWQTAAADVGNDLRYYYPGSAFIGHSGDASPWPVLKDGRDISMYKNNNYGSSHSYHVLGEYTDWFAGYYHDSDFGFGHWSRYPYKPGKKIWIWALSRSGAIWEDLLTDTDKGNKQYTEIQTGLLFNQEADESTMSPFKHLYFFPGAVEKVTERWFPISATKGVTAISEEGILNVVKQGPGFNLVFQALSNVNDKLQISDNKGKILVEYQLNMTPEEIFVRQVDLNAENVIIKLKDGELLSDLSGNKKNVLERPLAMPENFNWESSYGLYTRGVEKSRQRLYDAAREYFNRCLEKDPDFIPAYTGLAELDFRQMKYDDAEKKVLKVISFDTYDPDANFLYGTILNLKKDYNKAKDAFGVTLRSPEYKSVSLNQLAILALKEQNLDEAWEYVTNAGLFNGLDLNIFKTAIVIARLRGDKDNYGIFLQRLRNTDPLSHFADFEKYYSIKDTTSRNAFISNIKTELKYEVYIELALWYFNAGQVNEALSVMELCPENPMADYLSAWLAFTNNDEFKSNFYLNRALKVNPEFAYPYRDEYESVLKWADQKQPNWKTKYYSALLYWSKGQNDLAGKYFTECGDQSDLFSFYLTRGSFFKQTGSGEEEPEYLKAIKYGSKSWRPYHILHGYYTSGSKYDKALGISGSAIKVFGNSYIIKFDHALSLLNTGKYDESVSLLEKINILPYEGAGYGRSVWRNANLLNALQLYSSNKAAKALLFADNAYKWPENLGVGRPYEVDERTEDFVKAIILDKLGRSKESVALFNKIAANNTGNPGNGNSVNYLTVLALQRLGRQNEAQDYLSKWLKVCLNKQVIEWAQLMNNGQKNKAAAIIIPDVTVDRGVRNSGGTDAEFKIVNEIALKLEIKK